MGISILVLLVGLGVYQTALPHSTLVGAVPVMKTQQELNICMNDCMRACVTQEGMETVCLDKCNAGCGV